MENSALSVRPSQPACKAPGLSFGLQPTVCVLLGSSSLAAQCSFPCQTLHGSITQIQARLPVRGPLTLCCIHSPPRSATFQRFGFTLSSSVSSCCLYLPTKQHWLDFPCASLARHVQNHLPHKVCSSSASSISVSGTTISPAAQARNQGAS